MNWALAGWAGIAAGVAMGWQYISAAYSYLISLAVVVAEVDYNLRDKVLYHLRSQLKQSHFGQRNYHGMNLFVKPRGRRESVALLGVANGGSLFWRGWLPVWVNMPEDNDGYRKNTLSLMFLRGTLDIDEFISDAVEVWNNKMGSQQTRS